MSALGYRSPTLAQLMSRYATIDPTLISPASDKRKAPSLIASPAIKKKRTRKNYLFRSEHHPLLNTMSFIILTIFIFAWFQTRTQQPLVITDSANASPTGKTSPSYSLIIFFFIGTYPLLVSCRGNFGEPNCGEFFSSAWFKFNLTKDPTIFSSTRNLSLTKDSSSFSSTRHPRALPRAWKTSFPHPGSQRWCKHEHPSFYFSFNRSPLIRQEPLFRRKLCHHQFIPLLWMTWLPKKEMKHLLARLYQRKIEQSWRKSSPWCKGMFRTKSGMLIF
jgi:hypothetical protein